MCLSKPFSCITKTMGFVLGSSFNQLACPEISVLL